MVKKFSDRLPTVTEFKTKLTLTYSISSDISFKGITND